MENKTLFRIKFVDETLTVHTQHRGSHDGKAVMVREEEKLSRKEYFKRKLVGK